MKSLALVGLLAFAAATCVTPRSGPTWVAVTGPANSEGPEQLVLEIGNAAWQGYGGVVSVETTIPLPVRLVGRASCQVYASFTAHPGSKTVIRFAADGAVDIEDWTTRDLDAGPALGESLPTGCPHDVTLSERWRVRSNGG
jgi:hypothetical protein